jgi:hypothetical protein
MGWVQMVVSSKQLQESKASHGNGCFLFFKLGKKVLPYLPCEDYESALGFSQIWGVAEEEEKKIQAAIVS